MFTSCKYNEPEIVIHNSRLFMYVGDYASVEVEGVKDYNFKYSTSRDESMPVFEAKKQPGNILVHALNVGTDTLWVDYTWSPGTGVLGTSSAILVTVLDN